MKNSIQISIPKPCHENWDKMTLSEKGRFCASCQKNVIDFTKLPDREVAKVLDENKNACGRFAVSQLNRSLIPKEKNNLWMATASGVIAFLTIGTNEGHAQKQTTEHIVSNIASGVQTIDNGLHEITGTVTDASGFLPGCLVKIENTSRQTQTDFDGNFKIAAKTGEKIVFEYTGLETEKITVGSNHEVKIIMHEATLETVSISTGGFVIGKPAPKFQKIQKKRTFIGRIFYSVGNLFK